MATDLNHVVLVGRLTRDLGSDERSFGYVGNGQARASVSIAVNRSRKNGEQWIEEANYFDVTIWGKTAENLKPYLTKGKQIAVDGYLKQDRWEKDGQKYVFIDTAGMRRKKKIKEELQKFKDFWYRLMTRFHNKISFDKDGQYKYVSDDLHNMDLFFGRIFHAVHST